MCAACVAWGLFGIVALPFGPVAWITFAGLLLLFIVSTRLPRVAKSKPARICFTFGVPLLGLCVGIAVGMAKLAIAVADPANWEEPDHDIQLGWVSDKNQSTLWDDGAKGHNTIYAWNLVDWSEDARCVYAFADDPKDGSIDRYAGRPLGRFYLVLECDTLKFHQFVRLEQAPPRFREKLARLQTDPRHKRQGPFVR